MFKIRFNWRLKLVLGLCLVSLHVMHLNYTEFKTEPQRTRQSPCWAGYKSASFNTNLIFLMSCRWSTGGISVFKNLKKDIDAKTLNGAFSSARPVPSFTPEELHRCLNKTSHFHYGPFIEENLLIRNGSLCKKRFSAVNLPSFSQFIVKCEHNFPVYLYTMK